MKKIVTVMFLVSLTACGIDNGTPSDGVIRHCSPGEILDPGHCNDACDQGTTHLVCAPTGTDAICAVKPGLTCNGAPLTPCQGDALYDQIGSSCQPQGCPANSGQYFCNGVSVICVTTSACVTPVTCFRDNDGDTVGGSQVQMFDNGTCPSGWVLIGGDCDDNDSTKQFSCTSDQVTCYRDNDRDGVATSTSQTFQSTTCPSGWAPNQGADCDDNDASKQYNCMTQNSICYRDNDRDGVATSVSQTFQQSTCPSGWLPNQGADCDDNDASKQYNCTPATTWYRDADGDSFGCQLVVSSSCQTQLSVTQPSGYVANSSDCNDTVWSNTNSCTPVCVPTTTSEANGLCSNGLDDDCDGYIDGSDHGCAPVCLPLNGGTLRVELTQSVRNACTNGVIIVWGPGGVEHRSSAGAAYFQEYVGSNWQGYVRFNLLCNPTNPSLAGQAGYWSGTTHNWPSVGSDLSDYGVNISLNGTTLGQDQVIVNPEGSGTVKIGQGWLPGCTNQ